jgi:hypothetical protein
MRLRRQPWGLWQAVFVAVLAAITFVAGMPWTSLAAAPICTIPGEVFEYEPYLPRTLTALQTGQSVTIVAIGGASTKGRAAGDDSRAWPARLEQALAERFPKARITVLNRGVPRESAAQMVARFDKDVLALKPDLVIWETATNDAVNATDVDAFRETLQAGVERLRAAVPEVMLMNPQFSRLSEFVVNFNRYTTILRGVADLNELPLFPRHEIMRYWAESGVFNYRASGREQRRELAIQLYTCIGTAVADMIVRSPSAQEVR